MSAPVLFLDCDGVINCRSSWGHGRREPARYDLDKIGRVLRVITVTGCKIVLSSTWRRDGRNSPFVRCLVDWGIGDHFHDDWRTRDLPLVINEHEIIVSTNVRGSEIAEWLGRHPEVTTFAIVDDDDDMLPAQAERFVLTSFEHGIQDEHCERLIALLSEGCPS